MRGSLGPRCLAGECPCLCAVGDFPGREQTSVCTPARSFSLCRNTAGKGLVLDRSTAFLFLRSHNGWCDISWVDTYHAQALTSSEEFGRVEVLEKLLAFLCACRHQKPGNLAPSERCLGVNLSSQELTSCGGIPLVRSCNAWT